MSTIRHVGWTLVAIAAASTGCAHGRLSQQLTAARAAMAEASMTDTPALEPDELAAARRTLALAEAEADGSRREAHYAYVAERGVRRAMADARRDAIEQRVALATRDLEEEETGLVTLDADVLFETDQAVLRPEAYEVLRWVVEELRSSGHVGVIAGYTDSRGSAEHNRELSQRRAEAVRAYLLARGVPTANVVAEGRGEASPIASNDTEAGRALNRRVEVSIYPTASASEERPRPRVAVASR